MSTTASNHSSEEVKRIESRNDAEDKFQPKSLKFWTIMIGLYLAMFLVALDRMIIATAIPRISDEFNSIQDIGWYGSAYMLCASCLMPVSGRIYQLYSTKWVFVVAILIFEIGSAICGAAPNSTVFIVGRAVAGTGSAFIMSGGMTIMIPLVPLHKRPVFNSMFGLIFGVSSVLGPLIGGAFTDHVTWRWCFYINLPVGAFVLLAVVLFLHLDSPTKERLPILAQLKRIDPIGISLFIPSIVCLLLALQWGGSKYAWPAPTIIGLLVTFVVLFIAFVVVEVVAQDTAIAPMRVVLNRSMAGTLTLVFFLTGGMMSSIYYLAIWFQVVKGESATQAGIHTIPFVLSLVVFGILVAGIVQKTGYYNPALLLSPLICAAGAALLTTLTPSSSPGMWIGYQILYGIGIGCGFQTSNLPAQNVLPKADVPLGMALMFFSNQLGSSVFLSVSQNVFSNTLVSRLSGAVDLDPKMILNSGALELASMVPTDQLQIVVEGLNYALTRVFVLAAALSACMIVGAAMVEWKKLQGKPVKKVDEEAKIVEAKEEKVEPKA